ncbi:MAG TPA: CheR family methyltransferase [Ktedonobacteraceae bacterium]|nr:CheR family methyltransferase [Ktedonobacteraceae bacterium]
MHETAPSKNHTIPVVGIGASAGGLEAITELLRELPTNLGLAYVIIQHLDPIHVSTLPALLSQVTSMPVTEGAENIAVEPDHVYVIAPNTIITIQKHVLHLHAREAKSAHPLTIDTFLFSLAEDQTTFAIGIILSGMGTDGTRGLQAIKDHGGMTFVQTLSSAKYPSMPQSALLAGCVDSDDTPTGIARALTTLASRFSGKTSAENASLELFTDREEELHTLYQILREATGIDFSAYKPATIKRRLLRHLLNEQQANLANYLIWLADHPAEVQALAQDLLIHVTTFFRDPETFREVEHLAFPRILQKKLPGESIRIWVMGCSTGEEVYSLAISLLEFLGEEASPFPIVLFATDLDPTALEKARAGIYPEQALINISEARRKRFFTRVDGGYQISKAVRERCVFARHNITRDPPFSRLDLISCRNVLIYLGTPLQKKVLSTFHYALASDGILLLGTSETVGSAPHLFTPLSEKHKFYVKTPFHVRQNLDLSIGSYIREERTEMTGGEDHRISNRSKHTDLGKLLDQVLLTRYLPTCVVIDHTMEIVHSRGPSAPYLTPASGQPSFNLLKMAHPDLVLELRSMIAQVRESGQAMKKEGLRLHDNEEIRIVTLEITPLQPSFVTSQDLLLILVRELPPVSSQPDPRPEIKRSVDIAIRDERIEQLEHERVTLRTETTLLIEQLEELNQDLQIVGEELRSSNEELQSINEELETSKEELQLINEELGMANQDLHIRNTQLQTAREYAEAIVQTIREPLLILNADLRIQQANQAFYQFFQTTKEVTEQRHLEELDNGEWNLPALRHLLSEILPHNHSFHGFEVEQHFSRIGHKTLLLNARRIFQQEQGTASVLLALEDITERKAREKQKEEAFIGIASHELKTPLTSLKAYAELLLTRFAQTNDEGAVQLLHKMERQIDKLILLVAELLDITQIETGQLRIRRELVDLATIVRESIETLEHMTPTQTMVIEGKGNYQVHADPERLRVVVSNLLSNAIKYAPASTSIVVKIAEEREEIILSVQDSGPGIEPDKHKHLFERFYRVSGSAEETYPGLGLGLYITAEIVKGHGGRIWVESEKGKGTTFFVTLPKVLSRERETRGETF